MYADNITRSMKATIDETDRRREVQQKYNEDNNITPLSTSRQLEDRIRTKDVDQEKLMDPNKIPKEDYKRLISDLAIQMDLASKDLRFEEAAELRDMIEDLKSRL